jgi:hypothetical protein
VYAFTTPFNNQHSTKPKKGLYPTDDIGYFGWVQGKAGEYSSQASVGL